jgi:hypothetical protein
MKAGRLSDACPRFEQSFALVAAPGTLLNWAICEDLLGRPALAWTKLKSFLALVPADDARRDLAKRRLERLEAELSWLQVTLSDDAPAGSALWVDGGELAANQHGTWLPMAPGPHHVELRGSDQTILKREHVVLEATQRHAISLFAEPMPARARLPLDVPNPLTLAHQPTRRLRAAEHGQSRARVYGPNQPLRNAMYASGGIALGALAASLVLGGLSWQAQLTVSDHCDGKWCDAAGLRAARRGDNYVALADVALVVGGVAALTSATLLWASTRQSLSMSVASRSAALSYGAAF